MDKKGNMPAPLTGLKMENSTELVATLADIGFDAVNSGALDGVPFIGAMLRAYQAAGEVREKYRQNRILRFLAGLKKATPEEIAIFSENLKQSGQAEEVGETILLVLERIDDTKKPVIIGRIMGAHVKGLIDWGTALRLAHIVNRCYVQDLEMLMRFRKGVQGQNRVQADQLFSAGVLKNEGIDGGSYSDPDSGGTIYALNNYGHLLVEHGLTEIA